MSAVELQVEENTSPTHCGILVVMQASRHAAEGLIGVAARDRDAVLVEASSLLLVCKAVMMPFCQEAAVPAKMQSRVACRGQA